MSKCIEDFLCPFEKKIDEMHTDIKSLLKFKWQVMGGAAIISVLFVVVTTILKLKGM